MAVESAVRSYATTYAGNRFRSRLEAKWAAFFDLVGWHWTYEPFDTAGYIPDFLVHGASPLVVEIGPCEFLSEFSEKATKPLAAFGRDRMALILGIDPLILDDNHESLPRAGYLTNDGELGWELTAPARWAVCRDCGRIGVWHEVGWYRLSPCGHHDGNNHLRAVPALQLRGLWAEAGSKTQWRSR